jgi:retron-type reverse transcriptase
MPGYWKTVWSVDEGTPQGGPLSPFLSNIVLDDLDKELARRGHRFCRRKGEGLDQPIPD